MSWIAAREGLCTSDFAPGTTGRFTNREMPGSGPFQSTQLGIISITLTSYLPAAGLRPSPCSMLYTDFPQRTLLYIKCRPSSNLPAHPSNFEPGAKFLNFQSALLN